MLVFPVIIRLHEPYTDKLESLCHLVIVLVNYRKWRVGKSSHK